MYVGCPNIRQFSIEVDSRDNSCNRNWVVRASQLLFLLFSQPEKGSWILTATQDSYVLVENFRYYVAPFNQVGDLNPLWPEDSFLKEARRQLHAYARLGANFSVGTNWAQLNIG
jgi:hypothetical protein